MPILLLIRHGENDWVGKKLAGHLPGIHLNEKGKKQAEELASTLETLPIKAIFSSPLERAIETAQPLAKVKNIEININDDLREINFGDWQGKTIKQLRRLKLWKTVQNQPSKMQFPQGESFMDAQKRLVKCVLDISEKYKSYEMVACFSHSDSIRLLVSHFLNMPLDSFQRINISTASITALIIERELTSLPFINLINLEKFINQFAEMEKHQSKTQKSEKEAQ